MFDGRRRLLRDLHVTVWGRELTVPAGFVTDFSSWPYWATFGLGLMALGAVIFDGPKWVAVLLVTLMPLAAGPRFSKTDVAGVLHDALFYWGRWGEGGAPVTFLQANRVWFVTAVSGSHPDAQTPLFWAWVGRIGLLLFSWPVWIKYRRNE